MAGSFCESKNITMCSDGKYRWVYELDLYKSSAVFHEVWRVIGGICLVAAVIAFVAGWMDGGFMDGLKSAAATGGGALALMFVLTVIGYFVFALMVNGKYCVLFEMDEAGVNHKQQEKHVKKSQLVGAITAIAGIAAGRPGVAGTGILAAARTSLYTSFDDVKELEILPKEHLIRLNETMSRNQVYAEDEDFNFVADFLRAHCRNAKVK